VNNAEGKLHWFALRVRSNFERHTKTILTGSGFETFLPTYRQRRSWSDRIKELDTPLFPGYMFCRFNPSNRLPLLKTPGVVNIIGLGNQPEPIPDVEIASLRSVVEGPLFAGPWPFLRVGQRVRIHRGPLAGVEGLLVEFKNSHRIVVSVALLQRSVSAELDGAWIRPVDESRRQVHAVSPAA
jgi:transcription antitermination factor NusG